MILSPFLHGFLHNKTNRSTVIIPFNNINILFFGYIENHEEKNSVVILI